VLVLPHSDLERPWVLTRSGVYKKPFFLSDSDACMYCGDVDLVLHLVFACPRWRTMKKTLEQEVAAEVFPKRLVALMLENEESWAAVTRFLTYIMKIPLQDKLLL
jgi:hypothetical protein